MVRLSLEYIAKKADLTALPGNYNFEIHKTIYQVRRDGVKTVALQMPEGLMMYGCAIADIVERSVAFATVRLEADIGSFTGALPLLLADVTYGACCIDDFTAKEMGAEMIVHYGHSCLSESNPYATSHLKLNLSPGIADINKDAIRLCGNRYRHASPSAVCQVQFPLVPSRVSSHGRRCRGCSYRRQGRHCSR